MKEIPTSTLNTRELMRLFARAKEDLAKIASTKTEPSSITHEPFHFELDPCLLDIRGIQIPIETSITIIDNEVPEHHRSSSSLSQSRCQSSSIAEG
jgi:hypothetical protein